MKMMQNPKDKCQGLCKVTATQLHPGAFHFTSSNTELPDKQQKHFGLALHTQQFHNWLEPLSVCATLATVLCFWQPQSFPPTAPLGMYNNAMQKHQSHYRQIPGKTLPQGRQNWLLWQPNGLVQKALLWNKRTSLVLKETPKTKCNRQKPLKPQGVQRWCCTHKPATRILC